MARVCLKINSGMTTSIEAALRNKLFPVKLRATIMDRIVRKEIEKTIRRTWVAEGETSLAARAAAFKHHTLPATILSGSFDALYIFHMILHIRAMWKFTYNAGTRHVPRLSRVRAGRVDIVLIRNGSTRLLSAVDKLHWRCIGPSICNTSILSKIQPMRRLHKMGIHGIGRNGLTTRRQSVETV